MISWRLPLADPLADRVGEVHVRVAFVGEHPAVTLAAQHDREMIAVIEDEGREHAEAADALLAQSYALANRLPQIPLDV
jgi:hypothetical protein